MSKNQLSPLRKLEQLVRTSENSMFGRDQWRLECGHEIFVSNATMYRARCWKCRQEQERTMELYTNLDEMDGDSEEYNKLLEQTRDVDEHPSWYDGPCLCQLCCSYGD